MLPSFVLVFAFCTNKNLSNDPCTKIVSGFLFESNQEERSFYVQDHEDGSTYQLSFENEIESELILDEFINVEISGLFLKSINTIVVDEIIINENSPYKNLALEQ